jgi:hypothetical protein
MYIKGKATEQETKNTGPANQGKKPYTYDEAFKSSL